MSERVVGGTNEPEYVAAQYASKAGLAARKSAYRDVSVRGARELAFAAVDEVDPRAVLEVGCGEGELVARMTEELAAAVVAVDQSPRMVELTRARGVDASVPCVATSRRPSRTRISRSASRTSRAPLS